MSNDYNYAGSGVIRTNNIDIFIVCSNGGKFTLSHIEQSDGSYL